MNIIVHNGKPQYVKSVLFVKNRKKKTKISKNMQKMIKKIIYSPIGTRNAMNKYGVKISSPQTVKELILTHCTQFIVYFYDPHPPSSET